MTIDELIQEEKAVRAGIIKGWPKFFISPSKWDGVSILMCVNEYHTSVFRNYANNNWGYKKGWDHKRDFWIKYDEILRRGYRRIATKQAELMIGAMVERMFEDYKKYMENTDRK